MQLLSGELTKHGDLVQGAYDRLISNNIYSDSFGEAVLSAEDFFVGDSSLQPFSEAPQHYAVCARSVRCNNTALFQVLLPLTLWLLVAGALAWRLLVPVSILIVNDRDLS